MQWGTYFPSREIHDNSTPTVSGGSLSEEHQRSVVRKDHRSHLHRIIKWLQENEPDVSDQSVRVVTIKKKATSLLSYFPANNYDLVYAGLDPKYIDVSNI